MKLLFAFVTDAGLKREINQDSVFSYADERFGLFCVADGVGGSSHGEIASSMITDALKVWSDERMNDKEMDFLESLDSLEKTLVEVNDRVYERFKEASISASTAVILFLCGDKYALLSVGDSRVYYHRYFTHKILTRDDTWENSCEASDNFSPEDIINHPNRGKLIKAIGKQIGVVPQIVTAPVKSKTRFLLCSDGLYKCCPEKTIYMYMGKANRKDGFKSAVAGLLDVVYKNGAKDNVSMILVEVV